MKNVLDSVIGTLAPHICIGCGIEGHTICARCLELAYQPQAERCGVCRKLSSQNKTCSKCRKDMPAESIYYAGDYEGVLHTLLEKYKYEYQRDAAKSIAVLMESAYYGPLDNAVICPVPSAPARVRERGFDHTKLLAEEISNLLELKSVNVLGRTTNKRQVGSTRDARLKQMKNEYTINKPQLIKDKNVIIIDDVLTTGSSIRAAAKLLKKSGAKSVRALIFAKQV